MQNPIKNDPHTRTLIKNSTKIYFSIVLIVFEFQNQFYLKLLKTFLSNKTPKIAKKLSYLLRSPNKTCSSSIQPIVMLLLDMFMY